MFLRSVRGDTHTLRFSLLTVHIETANFKDLAYYTERDNRVFPAYCAYEERQNLKFSCLLCKGAYGERQALRLYRERQSLGFSLLNVHTDRDRR
jgi:hypothetical protein